LRDTFDGFISKLTAEFGSDPATMVTTGVLDDKVIDLTATEPKVTIEQ